MNRLVSVRVDEADASLVALLFDQQKPPQFRPLIIGLVLLCKKQNPRFGGTPFHAFTRPLNPTPLLDSGFDTGQLHLNVSTSWEAARNVGAGLVPALAPPCAPHLPPPPSNSGRGRPCACPRVGSKVVPGEYPSWTPWLTAAMLSTQTRCDCGF